MVDAGTCGMRSCAFGVERLRVSVCWSDGVASEVNADTFPLLTRTVYDKEIPREMVWSALTKSSDFFLYLFTPGFRTGHTRGNVTWPNADTPIRPHADTNPYRGFAGCFGRAGREISSSSGGMSVKLETQIVFTPILSKSWRS
jgi:hypothetical protein